MIFGIGTDCVDVKRIEVLLNQFDEKVINRLFTKGEQEKAAQAACSEGRMRTFAKRYAAKEAFSKALGTGIGTLEFKDIEVVNLPSGAPMIRLSDKGQKILTEKTQSSNVRVHLSLSDEREMALAFVIIEI